MVQINKSRTNPENKLERDLIKIKDKCMMDIFKNKVANCPMIRTIKQEEK